MVSQIIKQIVWWIKVWGTLLLRRNYLPDAFDPRYVLDNFREIVRLPPHHILVSSWRGRIYGIRVSVWVRLTGVLFLGLRKVILDQSVVYTLLAFAQERFNPTDYKILKKYVVRKKNFLERFLARTSFLSLSHRRIQEMRMAIRIYEYASLRQLPLLKSIAKVKVINTPLLQAAQQGVQMGYHPHVVIRGLSGGYWMRGPDRRVIGLFKPFDEEPFAPNNPIGSMYQGAMGERRLRAGIYSGEMGHREVAAFLVDAFFGFGLVPYTQYAVFEDPVFYFSSEGITPHRRNKMKKGSFQTFVEGLGTVPETSFAEQNSVAEDIHLLFGLDIILGNTDRHLNNILFAQDGIVAIDHGLIFSRVHERLELSYISLVPQGDQTFIPGIVSLFQNFPIDALIRHLRKKVFLSPCVFDRLFERITLVRACIEHEKTLREIQSIMTRKNLLLLQGYQNTAWTKACELVRNLSFEDS